MAKKDRNLGREKRTKLEIGAEMLRDAILTSKLKPGLKLNQQDLAEEFDMSPTPVREILRRLEAEGLVVYIPRKGVYVSEVTAPQYKEVIPIRACLEKLAAELAVPQFTEELNNKLQSIQSEFEAAWGSKDLAKVRKKNYQFHETIYEAANSPALTGLINRMWPRFATDLLWIVPGRTELSIKQHNSIIEAIRDSDATNASLLMEEHILKSGEAVLNYIEFQGISTATNGLGDRGINPR